MYTSVCRHILDASIYHCADYSDVGIYCAVDYNNVIIITDCSMLQNNYAIWRAVDDDHASSSYDVSA